MRHVEACTKLEHICRCQLVMGEYSRDKQTDPCMPYLAQTHDSMISPSSSSFPCFSAMSGPSLHKAALRLFHRSSSNPLIPRLHATFQCYSSLQEVKQECKEPAAKEEEEGMIFFHKMHCFPALTHCLRVRNQKPIGPCSENRCILIP